MPPLTVEVDESAVIALVFVLFKFVLNGISGEGDVIVPLELN